MITCEPYSAIFKLHIIYEDWQTSKLLFENAVLYAFFGLRLLYIAWRSDSKASQKKEMEEVEEKIESGQGKTAARRFFSRFCTPIFLEFI
ncbi:putative Gdt1 family protein [Helianthus debilis subsp. tardiflorus]